MDTVELLAELEFLRKENVRLREALKYIIAWGPDLHISKTASEALNQPKS